MKFLTLTFFTLLSLVIEITANNESIGSEVMYFYYVYKMQYMSDGAKTIATACRPSGGTGMCYFDDFVKHIMEESFVQQYRPKTGDHTTTPSQSNLAAFKQAITQQSVSYRMDRLDSHLQTAAGGDIAGAARSQAALLETMLESANNAIDSGNALITDAESAHEAIEDAMQKRSPQAMNAVDNWLASVLLEDEQDHVSKTGAIVNWKETLDNVDSAVEMGDLTHDEGETLKTKMLTVSGQFGRDLTDVPVSDITHLSILRALQDSSTQIKIGVDRGDEEIDHRIPPPPEPVSSCSSSDYESTSSGSEMKKRRAEGFVAKLFKFSKRQSGAFADILEARQLQPLSVSKVGVTSGASTHLTTVTSTPTSLTPSPSSSLSSSLLSSSASSSSSFLLSSSTATSKGPVTTNTGYDMAVTTVFSAPPECTGGITTMATDTGNLWLNVIDPVPTVTMTKCYPSQFVASALATTTLPPFSKLVCPDQWESYNANSTYVVCCPQGFTLWAPHWTETARPGRNAYCSSVVWPSVIMDVTSYDTSAFATVLPETAGTDGLVVYATAFDGNTYVPLTSVSSSSQLAISSKSSLQSVVLSQSALPSKSSTLPFSSPATPTASTQATTSASNTPSKPSSTLSVVLKTSSSVPTTPPTKTSSSTANVSTVLPAISSLPSCGQTCMNNMLAQYSTLGCSSADPACVCRNANFGYGVRDCSNGACGSSVGASVTAWASSYCSIAEAAKTTFPTTATPTPTVTAISSLPSCGQTCMNNMIAQYSALGCSSPQAACLCKNANFGYGIRDCANGACGTAVASTVVSFGSAYCARATAVA